MSFIFFSLLKKKGNPIETVVQCSCENGGLDSFLLEFEKFVSEQEVSFSSQRNDFSKSTIILHVSLYCFYFFLLHTKIQQDIMFHIVMI